MKNAFVFYNYYKSFDYTVTSVIEEIIKTLNGEDITFLNNPISSGVKLFQVFESHGATLKRNDIDYIFVFGEQSGAKEYTKNRLYKYEFDLVLEKAKNKSAKLIPIVVSGDIDECWPNEFLELLKSQDIAPIQSSDDEFIANIVKRLQSFETNQDPSLNKVFVATLAKVTKSPYQVEEVINGIEDLLDDEFAKYNGPSS